MSNEETKGHRELEVFREFARLSGLSVDLGTLEKRIPPEPDLLCRHDVEGPLAFELVELCDPTLAKAFADPERSGNQYLRTSDPSPFVIRRKLRKAYETTHPIELLCYTAGRVMTPANVIIPAIRPYLRSFSHAFRRAWLFSNRSVTVVWDSGDLLR